MSISSNNMMYDVVHTIKEQGSLVDSRIGPTRETLDLSVTFGAGMYYTRPGMNPWIGWTEIAQLIAGTFDWKTFEAVAPKSNLELFTSNMAYGPRIANQWEDVIDELTGDPLSRRAVMFVGNPHEAIEELPCTKTIQFLLRKEHLVTIVNMRSWDVFKGLPYDIMMFTALAQVTANILQVPAAEVIVSAGSAHVYESDFDRIDSDESKWKTKFMSIPSATIPDARKHMNVLDTMLRFSKSREDRQEALAASDIEITDVSETETE